jgi:PAS domain S-box-containing protein
MGSRKTPVPAESVDHLSLFRRIAEQAPIAMAVVGMDGVIEFINRKAVHVFGYAHEDIPNMDRWWAQAYPDETYAGHNEPSESAHSSTADLREGWRSHPESHSFDSISARNRPVRA